MPVDLLEELVEINGRSLRTILEENYQLKQQVSVLRLEMESAQRHFNLLVDTYDKRIRNKMVDSFGFIRPTTNNTPEGGNDWEN